MTLRYRNPDEAEALGDRLRLTRKNRGLTLVDLQEATGINHSQISRIERGQFKSNSRNVQNLCIFLQISDEQVPRSGEAGSLALRLERLASSSSKWMNVVAALTEALEDAQRSQPRPEAAEHAGNGKLVR